VRKISKPEVTLIVSSSVDGCLVGRDSDELDRHKEWKDSPIIRGVVQQFYDFSTTTDIYNLITASTMIRLGLNEDAFKPKKGLLNLIVLDMQDELTLQGISHLSSCVTQLIVVFSHLRPDVPETKLPKNCRILVMNAEMRPAKIMSIFARTFGISKITIQSAGKLNSLWLNANTVDYLTIIVYPLVVSNNGTPTFSSINVAQHMTVKPLQLISAQIFDTHYVSLRYKVVNTTVR